MSDLIGHHCGIALVRLLKPLEYYEQKYGTALYGFRQLFLLMEKQHNRGQDGAGVGAVKLNMPQGRAYMFRDRALGNSALDKIFQKQLKRFDKLTRKGVIIPEYIPTVKEHFDFGAEVLIGHLRYGTSGAYATRSCHPYLRRSNWPTRCLMVLGNFNMTNTAELNQKLIERGQHPIFDTDTQTILEEIGFHLDEEHNSIYRKMRDQGIPGPEIPGIISEKLDMTEILRRSAQVWDGGYVIAGLAGNGDCFVIRDPNGIRPCYYLRTDEVVACASERAPLMTVFGLSAGEVRELRPGHAAVIKSSGGFSEKPFAEPRERKSCSFERIYFSRGNDPDIYRERKKLGAALAEQILEALEDGLEKAVFSYIPNTAETAYYGLVEELNERHRREVETAFLQARENNNLTGEMIKRLLRENWPRAERIASKDIKLRTFISQEKDRGRLVSHVYDITCGVARPDDTLVVLDDSIVRGTTLKQSVIRILARARPRKIIIASTAPQIRYPDCYGIDMSELGKFIAFQAAVALLRERGKADLLREIYQNCLEELKKPAGEVRNRARRVYESFSPEEISAKITELVYPRNLDWRGPVQIIYQTIENLHAAMPEHRGDWYFTGHYPTPGGCRVANQAFVHYYENREGRVYDVT